jgi:hypothetical protein
MSKVISRASFRRSSGTQFGILSSGIRRHPARPVIGKFAASADASVSPLSLLAGIGKNLVEYSQSIFRTHLAQNSVEYPLIPQQKNEVQRRAIGVVSVRSPFDVGQQRTTPLSPEELRLWP